MKKLDNNEFAKFEIAMGTILKANPVTVKAAMEADKRERALEVERTGRRGRGRPPKSSSSVRVPS
jgi:predicted ArsR family transcriptional regulator